MVERTFPRVVAGDLLGHSPLSIRGHPSVRRRQRAHRASLGTLGTLPPGIRYAPYLFSDEVYGEDRPAYYAALANVRKQGNDLTAWLEYCAHALRVTLDRVWTRIQHLGASAAPKKVVLRPRQEQLLRLLKDRRSMTPKEIRESLRVSKQGAMDLLNPLLEAGLVQRSGTQKSGRYRLT